MKKLFTVLAAILVCVTSVFTSCNKDPQSDDTPKKALLIILDGWGINNPRHMNIKLSTPVKKQKISQNNSKASYFG